MCSGWCTPLLTLLEKGLIGVQLVLSRVCLVEGGIDDLCLDLSAVAPAIMSCLIKPLHHTWINVSSILEELLGLVLVPFFFCWLLSSLFGMYAPYKSDSVVFLVRKGNSKDMFLKTLFKDICNNVQHWDLLHWMQL